MDPAEVHAQRAFELLGKAEAVIANLLRDPTDQVARVQAQQWQRELEDLEQLVDQVNDDAESRRR
jgi:hypothetical protein